MKNTILIPLDGTESVEEILVYATSITPRSDTEILLLHVLPSGQAQPAAAVSAHLQDIHHSLAGGGWTVSNQTRMGDPVDEIVKFSMLHSATMLLMSTHGRAGLERIREGSVTEQVLKQSPCPVFVLHSTRAEPFDKRVEDLYRRILVPLDGTRASAAILDCVERFAKVHDSEVIIFHDEMEAAGAGEERTAIRETLQEHSVALANAGLVVTLDMSTYKRPIREILARIDERKVDLVAMVSHGQAGVRRALDESVTAEVIRHANCPLLVWSSNPQCPSLG